MTWNPCVHACPEPGVFQVQVAVLSHGICWPFQVHWPGLVYLRIIRCELAHLGPICFSLQALHREQSKRLLPWRRLCLSLSVCLSVRQSVCLPVSVPLSDGLFVTIEGGYCAARRSVRVCYRKSQSGPLAIVAHLPKPFNLAASCCHNWQASLSGPGDAHKTQNTLCCTLNLGLAHRISRK